MISTLLTKFGLPLMVFVFGTTAGMFVQQKAFPARPAACPQCPACICPDQTVAMQPFDMQKMKGVKEFNYQPEFSGSITVAGVDSTSIRKYIDDAVFKAFEKHVVKLDNNKRKRK